jgi:hypothetical protein
MNPGNVTYPPVRAQAEDGKHTGHHEERFESQDVKSEVNKASVVGFQSNDPY